MIVTRIVHEALPRVPADDSHSRDGAEIIFHGRVRDQEKGEPIEALVYEYYEGMAEKELQALGEETAAKFPISDLSCTHRVGRVAVGEAGVQVIIWSPHRSEGLKALAWFIQELKERVPIWKWAVTAEGEEKPTGSEGA